MGTRMEMPKFSGMLKFAAQLGAIFGVLSGCSYMIFGLAISQEFGVIGICSGIMAIIGSLAFLGFVYCFLAIVEAQVDMRNAILSNFDIDLPSSQAKKININDINFKEERLYD